MADDIVGRLVQNAIRLQRISNTVSAELSAEYQKLMLAITRDLQRIDPMGPGPARYRRMRADQFRRALDKRLRKAMPAIEKMARDRFARVGRAQALEAQEGLVATLGTFGKEGLVASTPVTVQRMRAILNAQPFEGRLMKEHMARLGANTSARVMEQVRLGMSAEEPIRDIVRRIRGRGTGRPGRFQGGVLRKGTRNVEAIVRTAVTFVSNEGHLGTYKANRRVVDGLQFVAVWDDRTTEICLSYDGDIFGLDSPKLPNPPLHYNCRSALVPVIAWKKLGLEQPPGGFRAVRDMRGIGPKTLKRRVSARRGTGDLGRAARVPSSVTATDWFLGQPHYVQAKMIGKRKARLVREGRISFKDIVRRDRTVRPLSELGVE